MKIDSNFRYLKAYCLILSLCIIYACGTAKKVLKRQNIAYQYQLRAFNNPLKLKFYQATKGENLLFIGIKDDELKQDINQWALTIKTYNSVDDKIPFDTLSTPIDFDQKVTKIKLPNNYNDLGKIIIDASLINLQNQKLYKKMYVIDEDDPSRYYLLRNKADKQPIFQNYISPNDEYTLEYKGEVLSDFKVIKCNSDISLPPPPYSEIPKETISKEWATTTQKTPLQFNEAAYYLISPSETKDTLALNCTNEKFPKLASVKDLVECLRYITKKKEYKAMLNSPNLEASIDSFWLDKAGSAERAKVLIREFYGRVQRANQFFTTDKMGWQTDRGLIYIIYGQAEIIYSREEEEVWKYVLPATAGSSNGYVVFHFKKEKNLYGLPSYHLIRDREYEESWHYVINEWRNGRISNISH